MVDLAQLPPPQAHQAVGLYQAGEGVTVRILTGDCRELLRTLPDASVNCCVTSPPYFGLRDYGVDGQMGREPTPDEYVAGMVGVFREVRRVLRDDGTLWLNIGDSYAGGGNGGGGSFAKDGIRCALPGTDKNKATRHGKRGAVDGIKAKDLLGIPWMLAFALRADGWYLRQDIIWSKPNPMPESVRDRCTKAHEYLFLLSKSPRYYFDQDAIREEPSGQLQSMRFSKATPPGTGEHSVSFDLDGSVGANKRSVWTVATQPFSEAHFATFPPDLIEPCILAGCPEDGTVLDPFFGAGTTGLVADRLQRVCIGIELNPEYAEIARNRLRQDGGMFMELAA